MNEIKINLIYQQSNITQPQNEFEMLFMQETKPVINLTIIFPKFLTKK